MPNRGSLDDTQVDSDPWPISDTDQALLIRAISHRTLAGMNDYNDHSHNPARLTAALNTDIKFDHKKPLDYAFEYRHWRDLLLREQDVVENLNEAHIIDLDMRAAILITRLRQGSSVRQGGKIVDRLKEYWPKHTRKGRPIDDVLDDVSGWFVRTERRCLNVSCPVGNFTELVEVVLKSEKAHRDFDRILRPEAFLAPNDVWLAKFWKPKAFSLYLSPWKPSLSPEPKLLPPTPMWRVFVPPRFPRHESKMFEPLRFRVSAIAQLHCGHAYLPENPTYKDKQKMIGVIDAIINICLPKIEKELDRQWEETGGDGVRRQFRRFGFVFDVFESGDGGGPASMRILDIKPFGALSTTRSAAGSWIKQAKDLYGLGLDTHEQVIMSYLS